MESNATENPPIVLDDNETFMEEIDDDDEEHHLVEIVDVDDDEMLMADETLGTLKEELEIHENDYDSELLIMKNSNDNKDNQQTNQMPSTFEMNTSMFQCDICKDCFPTHKLIEKHMQIHSRKKVGLLIPLKTNWITNAICFYFSHSPAPHAINPLLVNVQC